MTRFFKVLVPGRQCLMQGSERKLKVGDIICTTFGLCMLKVGTPTAKSVTTSMFNTECTTDRFNNAGHYVEITDQTELRKLIPHLPSGKTFKNYVGDVKSEMLTRLTK